MDHKGKSHSHIYIILTLSLLIVLSICILRNFFFNHGLAQYRDLSWPYISDYWLSRGGFVWDTYFQTEDQIYQKSIYLWLSQFPPEVSERLIYLVVFIVMDISMFYVVFRFTNSITASVIATLFFVFNPVVASRMQHRLLLLSYALIPLFFYLTYKLFRNIFKGEVIEFRYIILISILWLFMSTSPHWALFSALIIFYNFISFLFSIKANRIINYFKRSMVALTTMLLLYIMLSAFWIIPYILQSMLGSLHPPYVFSEDTLSLLSRNAQLLNVIRLYSYWWPGNLFSDPPISPIFWTIMTFLPPILVAIPLLFFKSYTKDKKHIIISIEVLALILVFLAKGTNPPFDRAYTFLCFKIPLISSIGWLFRDPHKWTFLLSFSYSILIGFLVSEKLKIRNTKIITKLKIQLVFVFLLLIIPLIIGYPLITGDLNGKMKPQIVPYEYKELDGWLGGQNEDFKVAFYPQPPPWGSAKPTIRYNFYWNFFIDSILNNKTKRLGALLSPWNVRYIIVRTKPSNSEMELTYFLKVFKQSRSIIDSLDHQDNIKLLKKLETLYVFENLDRSVALSISINNLCILDNLNILNSLSQLKWFGNNSISVYFLSQNNIEAPLLPFKKLIVSENSIGVILNYIIKHEHSLIIRPFDATTRHYPAKTWSKATTLDLLHGDWHPYLKRLGIENWQFDYSYGLAFTWAIKHVPEHITPEEQDLIKYWSFNVKGEFLEWKNNTPVKQFNAIQKLKWEGGALKAELYNSTWGWKVIKSPFILARFREAFRFSLKIKGKNAQSVHIKVFEFDRNMKYLTGKYVKGVGSGNFDWKTITFNYVVQNPNTSYIQLQIWHGHETKQPLPNEIWIDDVKVYNITRYAKPVNLEIPFKVSKSGNYLLFIRYFENQKGGRIAVYLDDREPIIIKTRNQLNKFVWKDLGTFHLKAGSHRIILKNIEGFNAVNLFVLVPENEFYKAQEEVKRILQNKIVIYIFEAESDLYYSNAKIVRNINASNGRLLALGKNSRAWQDLEIIKSGTYKIALKGIGIFKVKIGNTTFILNADLSNFTYSPPFNLAPGKYRLEIAPATTKNSTMLDAIWLYSSNKTIDQLFEVREKPAKIMSYEKINPTLWRVRVVASKPFMLSFAEAYDPLWEARVYRDGVLVEKVRSIPLYSVINGFWINETGNLTIVIRYLPQDWFELGLKISATTFASCIFYLFWDWRREKGDKWALGIEKLFRRMVRGKKYIPLRRVSGKSST